MLKSIATARGECTMKYENMASSRFDLLPFAMIEKLPKNRLKIARFMFMKTEKKLVWFKYFQ